MSQKEIGLEVDARKQDTEQPKRLRNLMFSRDVVRKGFVLNEDSLKKGYFNGKAVNFLRIRKGNT